MMTLEGKGALIVGARRVGGVVARRLAEEGVNLAISYRNSAKEAETLRSSVAGMAKRTALIQGDLTIETDVKRMVASANTELGNLSFVVNMASEYPRAPFETLDATAWDTAMADAKGSYLLTLHAARVMENNPGPTRGHVILFGDSAAGETPYTNYLPYLTEKAAVHFMTRAFAVELSAKGILVNTIAPGPTMRPPDIKESVWEQGIIARTPLRRESSVAEMAELVVTILKSETMTGEIIRVDAGRHLVGLGDRE